MPLVAGGWGSDPGWGKGMQKLEWSESFSSTFLRKIIVTGVF